MRGLSIAALGLPLVAMAAAVAALLAAHGPSAEAQPVASIALPDPGGTEQLYSGCNPVSLTFPHGTASETVVASVTPAGAVESLWRFDPPLKKWEGFSPVAPRASDLLKVDFLDSVWICVGGAPVPAATAPPVGPPVTPVPPAMTCREDPLGTVRPSRRATLSVVDECLSVTGTILYIAEQQEQSGWPDPDTYVYIGLEADDGANIVAVITPFDLSRLGFAALPSQWLVGAGDHVLVAGALVFDSVSQTTVLLPTWSIQKIP